jgi:serine/threonine protein kinase/tetratricopeptide (TPR) repeat protein
MTHDDLARSERSGPLGPGSRLGPYQILGLLGAGGMGQIYKAFDARLGREVAIKVAEEQFSERFDREVRAIAALNHPNICTVYDVGADYLVMELVDGETLRDGISRGLPRDRVLTIARQVLGALGAAHRAGVIHRDLKPENVMVRIDGYVKVLDFGLAKWLPTTARAHGGRSDAAQLSRTGQLLGTLAYMSPEQIEGDDVDGRSDLFAFGIILYEMLAGHHPWPRRVPAATLHAILSDDPPAMDSSLIGADLAAIVDRLLRKHPAERYPQAEAVLDALATPAAESSAANRSTEQRLTSVAVLPFVFLNDAQDTRALSLGFADALITILGNLQDVVVAPTSAILNYTADTEPAQVCRDLGVRHALQGTVQRLGSHWRVSIQLFDATTHKITLSEKHDFDLDNVFEVQDEIGRRVVVSLESRFLSTAPKMRDRYSSDPEAYGEFMAGLRESASDQHGLLQSAAAHLANAIERDPEFALAHAWLAHVAMQIHFYFDTDRTWLETAEQHCARALELDPACPEAYWARSAILWSPAKNFQHAEAIAALEQVLAARPNFDRAHNRMAAICMHIGRFHEARMAHDHSQRSNPKNRTYNLEHILLYSGDFVRAEATAQAWLKESPTAWNAFYFAAQPPLMTGNLALAEQRLTVGLKLHPDEPTILSLQAILHARRNEPDAALECVRKSLDVPITKGHAHHTYYQVACVYAILGQTAKAMAWLERSADTGNPCWPFFKIDPHLQNLRGEPAFVRLVSDLEQVYSAIRIQRV